jgi:hypothetical protein
MPRNVTLGFPDGDPITALEERMATVEARVDALEAEPPVTPPVEPPVEPPLPIELAWIVAPGGNDENTGTLNAPLRTLSRAAELAQPGDTIYLRGGHHDKPEQTYLSGYPGRSLRIYGDPGKPITIASYPGEWAIIDGRNHPKHPRVFGDTSDAYEPRLVLIAGRHLIIERLEFRNSYGGGLRLFATDSIVRECAFRNNHAVGFQIQGSRNEVAYNTFVSNYSRSNDGNSANGMQLTYTDQLPKHLPGETATRDCLVHHNVSFGNSDDGYGAGTSIGPNVFEYNVAFDNGIGATGNGEGFKMGLGHVNDTGNVWRYNISWGNRVNFNTNTAEGVLCHNNTSWNGGDGIILTTHRTNACDNVAHSNLSIRDDGGFNRVRGECTKDTHNVGWPRTWVGMQTLVVGDPLIMSFDPDSPNFLAPAPDSPLAGAGKDGRDIGAIPAGGVFADGWDWQALVRRFPRVDKWPM